jgi:ribonuclease HIII
MRRKILPTFKIEKSLWKRGFCVIGVDEVGRGALAGPLYTGAVVFNFNKARYRVSLCQLAVN